MKRALYLALFLAITAGLAGGMLSFVNQVTEVKIADAALEKEKVNLDKIFPGATFEQKTSEVAGIEGIQDLFIAEGSGTVYKVTSKGYGGDVVFLVGFDNDQSIAGIAIISQSETPGIGDVITTEGYQSTLVGKKASDTIDVSAGATFSSTAINNGIRAAFAHLSGGEVATPAPAPTPSLALGDKVALTSDELKTFKTEIVSKEEQDDKIVYVVSSEGYGLRDPEFPGKEYKPNEFTIILDKNTGAITSVEVTTFGDTKGMGDKIENKEYLESFVGVSSLDEEVDTVSSATISSKSLLSAIQIVLEDK